MSVATIQSGDTIWGIVKAKLGAGASNADIQNATQKVLDANGKTWDSAKSMRAGDTINLDVLDPKPAADPGANEYFKALGDAIKNKDHAALAALVPDEELRRKVYEQHNLPAAPAAAETPAATPGTDNALAELGLGALPPSLAQLLNAVYEGTDPSISPFLSSLGFDPQALVNGVVPNGAVNTPGATPGAGPSFGGLSNFLNSQGGINPNNTNQLAFNTGSFVNQISGIQFTAFDPAKILAQFPGLVS